MSSIKASEYNNQNFDWNELWRGAERLVVTYIGVTHAFFNSCPRPVPPTDIEAQCQATIQKLNKNLKKPLLVTTDVTARSVLEGHIAKIVGNAKQLAANCSTLGLTGHAEALDKLITFHEPNPWGSAFQEALTHWHKEAFDAHQCEQAERAAFDQLHA